MTNISLNNIFKLNIELLNIFSQKKTFLIRNIACNSNKVNKNLIILRLDERKISKD